MRKETQPGGIPNQEDDLQEQRNRIPRQVVQKIRDFLDGVGTRNSEEKGVKKEREDFSLPSGIFGH